MQFNSTKKHSITLVAIDPKNKINNDHKKCCEYFDCDNTIYWPLCNDPCSAAVYRRLLAFFGKQKKAINIDINSFIKLLNPTKVQTTITSILSTSTFATVKYSLKTSKTKSIEHNFIIDQKKYSHELNVAKVLVEAETFTRELMITPGNMMTADKLESFAKQKFSQFKSKIKFNVLHKNDLQKKKMGLILAVGQASPKVNEPRIITVEYNNNPKSNRLAVVGKGIMFDTGGLNLKPGEHMIGMHMDMSGAAISLATAYALAKLNIKTNIVCLATIASNEISQDAYRVNDVITSYNGKTVEILNTDAEGRLALADAVTYAVKDLKADTVITVATLTGAIVVALGELYTGVWTSNKAQWPLIENASHKAGEYTWHMPLNYEFEQAIKNNTKIADIANVSAGRDAGSNTAAEFIKAFAEKANFIHMDIAGTNEYKKEPIATMIKTLFYFVKDFK